MCVLREGRGEEGWIISPIQGPQALIISLILRFFMPILTHSDIFFCLSGAGLAVFLIISAVCFSVNFLLAQGTIEHTSIGSELFFCPTVRQGKCGYLLEEKQAPI